MGGLLRHQHQNQQQQAGESSATKPFVGEPVSRGWLLAHDDEALSPEQASAWAAALQRRAAGEPLAYVLGEQIFCGLRLQVTPAVLVPRPETEDLVRWALQCLQGHTQTAPRVIELGTGSGAIALALKHSRPDALVWATDISAAALTVAAGNAKRLNLAVNWALQDWWRPATRAQEAQCSVACANASQDPPSLPCQDPMRAPLQGPFDLVVSNPPYIAAGDPHLPALRHEPRLALVGADDGLGDLYAIAEGALQRLQPGGWLLLEHGHDQAQALQKRLRQAGYAEVQTRLDLAGLARCTGGRRP
jgi:release factor glutamine methyltransferase